MKPDSTLAAVLTGARTIQLTDVAVEVPGEGEVLIGVRSVGLCGSDAHWYEHGRIGDTALGRPLILGHEFCGVIESGPRAGKRVVVDPAIPCLACDQCGDDRLNLCSRVRFAGHASTDGALRRHLVWPERGLISIPDDIDDSIATMVEPLGVALHAIDLAALTSTSTTGVIGCGPIGLLLLVALRDRGVGDIVATEPLAHRRLVAGKLGARVDSASKAEGVLDIVFETSGTDDGLADAMEMARPGGVVVVVGIPSGNRTMLTASLARRKELTLIWSRRTNRGDLERATTVARRIDEAMARLVSHTYPLEDATTAFATLVDRRGLKVLVIP
jgi:L-iditol 2-dehydrogenase